MSASCALRAALVLALAHFAASVACAGRPSEPQPVRAPDPEQAPTARRTSGAPRESPPPPPSNTEPTRFLKGQTHVHTSGSYDAKTPPTDAVAFYAARGYDFIALTDHNRITPLPVVGDLLVVRGVELTQNSAACTPKPARGYRCLFHTTSLFVDPALDDSGGELIGLPFRAGRVDAYRAQLAFTRSRGGLAVINHPLFHFALDARSLVTLARDGAVLVELFDAALDEQHPAGRASAEERAERVWDEILSAGALMYAVASDDAHHFADAEERRRARKHAYAGDRGWIRVRARRDEASIRAALESGDFYSSTGVELESVTRGASGVALNLPAGESGTIRFVGRGGRELARLEGSRGDYTPRGDEGYVRAVVERGNAKAWVQPVMLP